MQAAVSRTVVQPTDVALLAAVFGVGFFVEAVAGFGGTVIALALASRWFAIDAILAWLLPLNLALSAYLVVRYRRAVDGRVLVRRVFPAMGVGMAAGTAIAAVIDAGDAAIVFAGVVVVVAVVEIVRLIRRARAAVPPPAVQVGVLAAAGTVHGMFATGGPLAVAMIGRLVGDKGALRATLAVLWLALNLVVAARLVATGYLDGGSLAISTVLVPSLAVALVVGEAVHARVNERAFRWVVALLLAVIGGVLVSAHVGSAS
jgi:uncharacterized membrane protein YfcA